MYTYRSSDGFDFGGTNTRKKGVQNHHGELAALLSRILDAFQKRFVKEIKVALGNVRGEVGLATPGLDIFRKFFERPLARAAVGIRQTV